MKLQQLQKYAKDIWLCTRLRMKVIISDRLSCVLLGVVTLVFCILLGSLNLASGDSASLPIGVADEDGSQLSAQLVDGLKSEEALNVYYGTASELEEKLYAGDICALFIIEEDYESRVERGDTQGLITLVSASDDKVSVVLSDIFAGVMLEDICNASGRAHYREVSGYAAAQADDIYNAKLLELSNDESLNYTFNIELAGENSVDGYDMTNAFVYRQLVAGMCAIALSFISFFLCISICSDKEQRVRSRRGLAAVRAKAIFAGDFAAVSLIMIPVCAVFSAALAFSGGFSAAVFVKLLLTALLYSIIMDMMFVVLASLMKKVSLNCVIGSAVVAAFGICGFLYVFRSIAGVDIPLAQLVPNSFYIERIAGLLS